MGVFPDDFPGLLIPIAIFEGLAGLLKSKDKRLFWPCLLIEFSCATVQSAALIAAVSRGNYSRLEIAAAYTTVIGDSVLLLFEACVVYVKEIYARDAGVLHLYMGLLTGVVLASAGGPILIAKFVRKKELKRFKSVVPARLMFTLPIFPAFAVACSLASQNKFFFLSLLCVCSISVALGVEVLKPGESLSLAFQVIANIYPALVTLIPAFAVGWSSN